MWLRKAKILRGNCPEQPVKNVTTEMSVNEKIKQICLDSANLGTLSQN